MSEITREYLENIGFDILVARLAVREDSDLHQSQKDKIAEMIRVWEATEPQPEALSIEYCITYGPGTLLELGVVEGDLSHTVNAVTTRRGRFLGYSALHVAPTTTSCMTGK